VYEQALVLHHRAGEFPAKQVVKSELTTWYRGSHALPEVVREADRADRRRRQRAAMSL
jgi:hypothetical protein